jgi:hypothetical protein
MPNDGREALSVVRPKSCLSDKATNRFTAVTPDICLVGAGILNKSPFETIERLPSNRLSRERRANRCEAHRVLKLSLDLEDGQR